MRDANGVWQCDFSMTIGQGTIFQVEAKAMLEGLRLAWDKGYRKLELKCDHGFLVETIVEGGAIDSKMTELRLIYNMLKRLWDVRIRHIPRT